MSPDFPYHCLDCGMNLFLEWFMVHDDVWRATGLARSGGTLCIGCVERRVGRTLGPDDFTAVDNNKPTALLSDRFLDRLGYAFGAVDGDGNELTREEAQPWILECDNPPP